MTRITLDISTPLPVEELVQDVFYILRAVEITDLLKLNDTIFINKEGCRHAGHPVLADGFLGAVRQYREGKLIILHECGHCAGFFTLGDGYHY